MIEAVLIFIPSALILLCSVILWVSKTYDDGIVGRAGLGLLAFSSLIIVAGQLFGDVEYGMLPEVVMGRIGIALFMVFHVRRHLGIWMKERRSCVTQSVPPGMRPV